MRVHCSIPLLIMHVNAFNTPNAKTQSRFTPSYSATEADSIASATDNTKTEKTLALLTFDLDDTLYSVAPVINDANEAFAKAMHNFGFDGIERNDIIDTARKMRAEIALEDPKRAAALSHTEIRMMAIRRQMETKIFLRSLEDCAADEAIPVSYLSSIIVNNAKIWAAKKVSTSVVQAVYNAWEMERHHAQERHIYPEVIDMLEEIKKEHPNVIIGAVTDGRANPMLMTFTLAKYFDFCMSWEDDQAGREKFFKELGETDSETELKWIYEAALERYKQLASFKMNDNKDDLAEKLWIHVGDDLAYDVGGSAACGAKTIYMELADKYAQTSRYRFTSDEQVSYSIEATLPNELEKRKKMNDRAEKHVDKRISYMSALPEAIKEILDEAS